MSGFGSNNGLPKAISPASLLADITPLARIECYKKKIERKPKEEKRCIAARAVLTHSWVVLKNNQMGPRS